MLPLPIDGTPQYRNRSFIDRLDATVATA